MNLPLLFCWIPQFPRSGLLLIILNSDQIDTRVDYTIGNNYQKTKQTNKQTVYPYTVEVKEGLKNNLKPSKG